MNSKETICISDRLISECHKKMIQSIRLTEIGLAVGVSASTIEENLDIAIAESFQTLSLLHNLELEIGDRILEVGAGYGLASICLALMGFEVVALEPGGLGFEENREASIAFADACGVAIGHISESAEAFDFWEVEKFKLIVSNNVLEHIPDFNSALTNLNNALAPDGIMIHSCANYAFPFEPHFRIPLMPLFPKFTSRLLPETVTDSGLWQSLNFIKLSQVKRNVRRNGMSCVFRRGTMSKSIRRLRTDQEFSKRHKGLAKLVRFDPLFRLLIVGASLPRRIATPMDFVICSPQQQKCRNVQTWISQR
jgi:2-polyprenyl-3-methyl-5-hydroxy-6-metoxy-1,4-benzoquinol methylase